MITFVRTPCPLKLAQDGPGEIAAWRTYKSGGIVKNKKGKPTKPTFSVYKSKQVRDELDSLFYGKCAYCESFIGHITPFDVEHWHPKGSILTDQGLVEGYWWLAAEWNNLFPACPNCNRPTKHELPGGGVTAGKGMRFPVNPGRTNPPAEGDEVSEVPRILNPTETDAARAPERHLVFASEPGKEGIIQAVDDGSGGDDDLGAESISVYALNRAELVERRRQLDADIRLAISTINAAIRTYRGAAPGSQAATDQREIIDSQVERLRRNLEDRAEYLLLARQLAQKYLTELQV
jgi:5-methylcytosine-specific restriction endonuclease McrA